MIQILSFGFLSGLSTGIYCFAFCFPFLTPILLSEEKRKIENFVLILKFLFGRLSGYLLFGAIFGFLGQKIKSSTVDLFSTFSLMVISLILIFHAFGLLGEKKILFCQKIKKLNPQTPFLIGFLNGVNICPPFLISLNYIFLQKSPFFGILYFFAFFCGTSLYFLPLFFVALLNKMKEFQLVGRISSLLVGILFFFYSIYLLFGRNIWFHKI